MQGKDAAAPFLKLTESELFLPATELVYFLLAKPRIFTTCYIKGTVSREKLLNWGLGKMVWSLIIDRTWVLHFSDQLFNCHNIWTVCCLDVKPVWSLSETDALRWLIVHAGFAVRCLLVCRLQASSATPPHPPPVHSPCRKGAASSPCSPHPNTVLLLQSAQY